MPAKSMILNRRLSNGYSHLWWIYDTGDTKEILAGSYGMSGYAGQKLWVISKLKSVFVYNNIADKNIPSNKYNIPTNTIFKMIISAYIT